MPVSLMRNGLTAENSIFSQKPSINVKRSKFDLSRLNCFTSDIGMLVPVDLIPTLPGDVFDLSCQYQIDFRPLLVPTLTAYKVRVHYYYCKMSDLYEGWESFISKGRSGNLSLVLPSISYGYGISDVGGLTDPNFKTVSGKFNPRVPCSLFSYLCGKPLHVQDSASLYKPFGESYTSTGFSSPASVNVLPFLMYQKIYRSNYLDPNLYSNGVVKQDIWFPDDLDSSLWRFDFSSSNFVFGYKFAPIGSSPNGTIANFVPLAQPVNSSEKIGDDFVNILQLRYAMFTNDMFTTALPFLQRGLQTSLDLDVNGVSLTSTFQGIQDTLTFSGSLGTSTVSLSGNTNNSTIGVNGDTDSSDVYFTSLNGATIKASAFDKGSSGMVVVDTSGRVLNSNNDGGENYSYTITPTGISNTSHSHSVNLSNTHNHAFSVSGGSHTHALNVADLTYTPRGTVSSSLSSGGQVQFTAQNLRSLLAMSVWQERNALTNGSYGQFIKVHFDHNPNNKWCEPIYIGGVSSVFNMSTVVQTSASTEGSTPQGNPSGLGSSRSSDKIGRFTSPDYGYIMAIMSIIPDTVYSTINEHWTFETTPDDFYFPEFEQLSYQPIPNKMLGDFRDDNEGLFGYSNRYVYMKQRDNIVRGMFSLPSDKNAYFHSYVQQRAFTSVPKLSQQFVTCYPPNIDRSFLAYTGEPCFLVQFYSGVKAVRPLSYASRPNDFGF